METSAKAKFARYAPRKVGHVLELVRNKPVNVAFNILKFLPKSSALLVGKVLHNAVVNANRLKNLDGLFIKECWVNQGPSLKRFRARAFGRAAPYKRKTCHLTVVITDERR